MGLYVPWANKPDNVTVRTSGYTIPAGKYARITPQEWNFTIDGNSPMFITSKTIVVPDPGGKIAGPITDDLIIQVETPDTIHATVYGGVWHEYDVNASFANGYFSTITGKQINTNTTGSFTLGVEDLANIGPIIESQVYYFGIYGNGAFGGANPTYLRFYRRSLHPIWVPTGTVLAGSRYYVEEYNEV